MDRARRHFLRGGFFTCDGRERFVRCSKTLGPAPPWHVGKLLKETCASSEHPCEAACDMDIIRLHGPKHGLAGTPYLSFESGGCTYCRACVHACPMKFEETTTDVVRIGLASLDR